MFIVVSFISAIAIFRLPFIHNSKLMLMVLPKKKLAHVENRVEQFIEILRDIMNISRATFTFYFLLPASRPVSLVLYLPLNTRQREIL